MQVDTILVPTDFSEHAENALKTATELAKLFGAKIVLLHAYHVDIPIATPLAGSFGLPDGFFEELRAQAQQQVDKAAAAVKAQGIEISAHAVHEPASIAIVAHAESLPADLIVMGTRGNTGLKHVALGSVAERVVRTAPCPVLTLKSGS